MVSLAPKARSRILTNLAVALAAACSVASASGCKAIKGAYMMRETTLELSVANIPARARCLRVSIDGDERGKFSRAETFDVDARESPRAMRVTTWDPKVDRGVQVDAFSSACKDLQPSSKGLAGEGKLLHFWHEDDPHRESITLALPPLTAPEPTQDLPAAIIEEATKRCANAFASSKSTPRDQKPDSAPSEPTTPDDTLRLGKIPALISEKGSPWKRAELPLLWNASADGPTGLVCIASQESSAGFYYARQTGTTNNVRAVRTEWTYKLLRWDGSRTISEGIFLGPNAPKSITVDSKHETGAESVSGGPPRGQTLLAILKNVPGVRVVWSGSDPKQRPAEGELIDLPFIPGRPGLESSACTSGMTPLGGTSPLFARAARGLELWDPKTCRATASWAVPNESIYHDGRGRIVTRSRRAILDFAIRSSDAHPNCVLTNTDLIGVLPTPDEQHLRLSVSFNSYEENGAGVVDLDRKTFCEGPSAFSWKSE